MRKKNIILAVLAGLPLVAAVAVGYFAMRGIMHYPPLTLEQVYGSGAEQAIYGIGRARTPGDYGYAFQETSYRSAGDIALHGWYVAPKNPQSDKCYLLIHGRSSNRLKSLKYLELISALGLNRNYGVFMPDLRNSGRSDAAPTAMGYYFAEDILHTMLYLNSTHGHRRFVLHGFSMGAMGISCLLVRVGMMDELRKRDIVIEGIILDSPVANVWRTVYADITGSRGLPSVVARLGLAALDMKLGGFLKNMSLGKIYAGTSFPVLVLAARDDTKTPIVILEAELATLSGTGVRHVFFEKGGHARLFNESRGRYTDAVKEFLDEVSTIRRQEK